MTVSSAWAWGHGPVLAERWPLNYYEAREAVNARPVRQKIFCLLVRCDKLRFLKTPNWMFRNMLPEKMPLSLQITVNRPLIANFQHSNPKSETTSRTSDSISVHCRTTRCRGLNHLGLEAATTCRFHYHGFLFAFFCRHATY